MNEAEDILKHRRHEMFIQQPPKGAVHYFRENTIVIFWSFAESCPLLDITFWQTLMSYVHEEWLAVDRLSSL